MTAETSNARGETYTFDMIEDAWGDAVPLTKPYFNRFRARLETLRQSAAPPPAAARVDVRGLVTLAEQWERDAGGCRRDGYMDAAVVKENCAFRLRQALGISAIGEALAAEGVQAEEDEQRARELLEAECGRPLPLDVPVCAALSAVMAALAQQPAAVDASDARDAERYRWLRRALLGAEDEPIDHLLLEKEPETEAEFDAAVDAALAAQQGGAK